MKPRLVALVSAVACLAAALPTISFAQAAWPEKSVTVVVPFPPGGSTDTVARAMAAQMQTKLRQLFVVDNKPGATGAIGATLVKRAAPDGYTIMVSSLDTYVIAPHLMKSPGYDALKDFYYLSVLVQAPNVLVGAPGKKARIVADVIAELKASPGKVSFASSGNGASDHLSAEQFWPQTGTAD